MTQDKIVIAIDGHSSCGKSTMAKALAQKLNYLYIDSGAMYRAVTLYSLRQGLWQGDTIDTDTLEKALPSLQISFVRMEDGSLHTCLNGEDIEHDIRTMEVSNHVSPISALPFVRAAMTAQQRSLGEEKGIVMDGRDIGTTVFPNAELKVFVTASPEIRALRRHKELIAKGENLPIEEVLTNLIKRDRIDSTREVSPLKQAADARVLDNSHLTIEQQNTLLLQWVKETLEGNKV